LKDRRARRLALRYNGTDLKVGHYKSKSQKQKTHVECCWHVGFEARTGLRIKLERTLGQSRYADNKQRCRYNDKGSGTCGA